MSKALTQQEMHNLAMNHVGKDLEQRGFEMWLTLEDTGVGIPQDQLDRIFKRFYQVESPLRRHHEGMGLGLSIAKDLVELHNGRIWAENLAKGSKFTIALNMSAGKSFANLVYRATTC